MIDIMEYLQYAFVQRMLIAGILASLACGVIGTMVVVRRNVFIAGGISHSAFGGIGFAYYLQSIGVSQFLVDSGLFAIEPLMGAVLFAIASALFLGSEPVRKRFREDSTIGVVWVLGMAAGVLFINLVDQSKVKVMSFESILFGNILLTSREDLITMVVVILLIYLFVISLFKDIELMAFDEEFARITGVKVNLLNIALLILIALTVTILIKVVGVVLVLAMLTIPAAISNLYTKKLSTMMISATITGMVLVSIGNILSIIWDTPPGATIVLVLGSMFIVSLMGKWIYIKASSFRNSKDI